MSKLKEYQLTSNITFRVNSVQKKTLIKLKEKYKIDISHFIRIAIAEKIKREYPSIQEKLIKKDCPF